jgi:hypothetical protein
MRKNKSTFIIIIVVVVGLGVLFALPRLTSSDSKLVRTWEKEGIECLNLGHQNVTQHFHPRLEIFIDGEQEFIPANVGVVQSCMAEVHTHDTSGQIHAESVLAKKEFKLANFFTVYNQSIKRDGYTVSMMVNGEENAVLDDLILQEGQHIILTYIKIL